MKYDFTFHNPTRIHFGKDSLNHLKEELAHYGPNVVLIYGGGSIKKNGLYDKVIAILKEANKVVTEDAGVMPNPTIEKLIEGAKIAREARADLLLAVGGGSVVDYAKAVSVSAYYEGDIWQHYFVDYAEPTCPIIPVGDILTMTGTGSEMNGGSVITNFKENKKLGHVFNPSVYPRFSILNPEYTYTVPFYQMVAGIYDAMCHIMEQYFSGDDDNVSDYMSEALMRSLITSSRKAVKDPLDYEARSNIMWAATLALNTLIGCSKTQDWEIHGIGQGIAAYTDATHGMTLSVVTLPYYRHIYKDGLAKFKRFAIEVWDVDPTSKSDEEIALEGLDKMEDWMKEIKVALKGEEVGLTKELCPKVAATVGEGRGGYKKISVKEVEEILLSTL